MTEADLKLVLGVLSGIGHGQIEDRAQLTRIERKLDTLIAALAADEEQEPELSDLEGQTFGGERDQGQSLD